MQFWGFGAEFTLPQDPVINSEVVLEPSGEMAEWLKAHAWKACIPQGIQGSNPCLSAIRCLNQHKFDGFNTPDTPFRVSS